LTSFKALSTIISPRKPGLDPRPVHVGSVIGKVALGWVLYGLLLLASLDPSYIIVPIHRAVK
jgi:hypothetical protein